MRKHITQKLVVNEVYLSDFTYLASVLGRNTEQSDASAGNSLFIHCKSVIVNLSLSPLERRHVQPLLSGGASILSG